VRPTRAQVIAAMRRVAPKVYDCFEDGLGYVHVRFSVSGETGLVTNVRMKRRSKTETACISRALRSARLPKFQKPTLEIGFPFRR
jgi:hypothetical protein